MPEKRTQKPFEDVMATLRKAYRGEVKRIAENFALQFQTRKFDNTAFDISLWKDGLDDDAVPPFDALETLCEQMPICKNEQTARMVIAASQYGTTAPHDDILNQAPPFPGHMWKVYAAWCLARDLHDEAIARGWSQSRLERHPPLKLERAGQASSARERVVQNAEGVREQRFS